MSSTDLVMAAAGTGGGDKTYVEDVFSTYLYTGNGSTQTITNGIDLAGEGGLIWTKFRSGSFGTEQHALMDTVRGANNWISTDTTGAQLTYANMLNSFNSNGYTLGSDNVGGKVNYSAQNYASWTFRKQPKFFDVVTYTGDGTSNRAIPHNLGSVPGMIIVKSTTLSSSWAVYHRSLGSGSTIFLNLTNASGTGRWDNTNPTATDFTVNSSTTVNASGETFVAYLFAHDAGGFGEAGTDNVISCGSFTTDGSGNIPTVNLGYEPQYLLFKASSSAGNWAVWDVMRGFSQTSDLNLSPNTTAAEVDFGSVITPTATGFANGSSTGFNPSVTYIYMAIRRSMKVPTTGTEVFAPITATSSTNTTRTTGFPVDLQICGRRAVAGGKSFIDRLRGVSTVQSSNSIHPVLNPTTTNAEGTAFVNGWNNTGFQDSSSFNGDSTFYYNFRRAPNFFDVVCYTGTGSARTVAHNLGVAPELMIVKRRNTTYEWVVYSTQTGNTKALFLNLTDSATTIGSWDNTNPTSSVFSVATSGSTNASGGTYVAYLFASCPGVSKVGSYTGNGSSQTINCGFTGGARFVMVKATSTTGDWVVVDTSRGLVSGNDPFLELNTTAAEQTGQDILDPDSSGFVVNQTTESINASGVSYIFLAIA